MFIEKILLWCQLNVLLFFIHILRNKIPVTIIVNILTITFHGFFNINSYINQYKTFDCARVH